MQQIKCQPLLTRPLHQFLLLFHSPTELRLFFLDYFLGILCLYNSTAEDRQKIVAREVGLTPCSKGLRICGPFCSLIEFFCVNVEPVDSFLHIFRVICYNRHNWWHSSVLSDLEKPLSHCLFKVRSQTLHPGAVCRLAPPVDPWLLTHGADMVVLVRNSPNETHWHMPSHGRQHWQPLFRFIFIFWSTSCKGQWKPIFWFPCRW